MTDEIQQILDSLPKPKPKEDPRTLNAYRHGLTGHVRFYTPADEQAYKKHCAGYMEDFAPKGAVETDLTQSVADGRWRIKRAAQIENGVMAITLGQPDRMKCDVEEAAIAFAYAWLERGKSLNLLTLYERRLQRGFMDDLRLLEEIQERRRRREHAAAQAAQQVETPTPPRVKPREPKLVFSTRPKRRRRLADDPPGLAA